MVVAAEGAGSQAVAVTGSSGEISDGTARLLGERERSAVNPFARCAARELGREGIGVSAVSASLVDASDAEHRPEAFGQAVVGATALGSVATAQDVARGAAFLPASWAGAR